MSYRADPGEAARALAWEAGLEPLVAVTRGGVPELVYRGLAVCVDDRGGVRGAVGKPDTPIHLRSAAKPFQTLALVETGAADALAFSTAELAVACGSHSGTPEQVAVVQGLLERLGLGPELLECARPGLSGDGNVAAAALSHMCSGKHAAMMALSVHLGVPIEGYSRRDHPVQQVVTEHVAAAAGLPAAQIVDGIDGCGVPVFRLPASVVAGLYARLMAGSTPALARLRDAMRAHPDLVAGLGRFDTDIMRAGSGRLIAKSGAGGVQALAWVEGVAQFACGVVIKLAGDAGAAGLAVAACAALQRWGPGDPATKAAGSRWAVVRNVRQEPVGRVLSLI